MKEHERAIRFPCLDTQELMRQGLCACKRDLALDFASDGEEDVDSEEEEEDPLALDLWECVEDHMKAARKEPGPHLESLTPDYKKGDPSPGGQEKKQSNIVIGGIHIDQKKADEEEAEEESEAPPVGLHF